MRTRIPVLLLGLILIGSNFLFAQNPYKSLGVEVETLTLSKGKFVEFIPNDSLVQIGSVMFNTRTNSIVSFVVYDTTYSEATLEPEVSSRFLQPDPLAAKYPEVSPYVYTLNNPIKYIDPDGREVCCEDLLAFASAWLSSKINGAKAQLSAMMSNSRASYAELDRMSPEQQIEFHEMKQQASMVEGALEKSAEYNETLMDGISTVVSPLDASMTAYEGDYGEAALKAGAEFIPFSAAGKLAAKGGRNAGFLLNNIDKPAGELLKSIGSLSNHVTKHMDYISNPSLKYKNWNKLRPEHQANIIKNWEKEIKAGTEQINILTDIIVNQ